MAKKSRRAHIRDTISDLVGSFLYYGRKEDEDLPLGAIEASIEAGEITTDDIVDCFRTELVKGLGGE